MKELIEKFQKMSAAQLISKMEKGVENEKEREIIINILQKRGRDVSPYVGKSTEEIVEEAKIDQAQKNETQKVTKAGKVKIQKAEKAKKVKKESAPSSKPKEIYFEHETFKVGAEVKILKESSKIKVGDVGKVIKVGHYEGKPENPFIYVHMKDGSRCSRNLKFVELV